jgi:hypothetical protein
MRKFRFFFSIYLIMMFMTSFGQTSIFEMSDFESYQKIHKKIAIVPIDISIDPKSMPRDLTVDDLNKLHKNEALLLQDYFYAVMLNENQNKRMTAELVDVRKTNAMLEKNNINFFNISKTSFEDMAKFSEVDGIVTVFIYKSNPVYGDKMRNRVDIKVSIHDKSGKLLWEYFDGYAVGPEKTAFSLAKELLEKAARKVPYRNVIKEPKK